MPVRREMIELGTITGTQRGSVREARNKVRQAISDLTGDALLASRVASVTSQLARTASRTTAQGRIDVRLDLSRSVPHFLLDFVGVEEELEGGAFASFFDHAHRVMIDGEPTLRLGLDLSAMKPDGLTDRHLSRVRAGIEHKGRDQLMRELQLKNRELQESFDNLRRTTTAKERMESELNIGRDIQMSMLPLEFPPFPHRNEFTVFATLHPAREVGGDFYDFFLIDEDRFCFCVGDVSGKGVPAALFMAVTKTLIKSRATNDFSPASILTHVNDEVADHNDTAMFVTLWLGILDVTSGQLRYTNAGHNPPYLKRADGGLIRLERRHGPVVGAVEGLVYGEDTLELTPDDLVFLYTDGVTEAMDPDGTLYEEDRLVRVLGDSTFAAVEEAVRASTDDVWRFQGEAEQADDVTVLAVEFRGRARGASDVARLHIEAENRLEEIDRVNQTFESFAAEHGLPDRVRRSMKLVFDDLLNNVISYAYDDDEVHIIEVNVELSSDRLAVRMADDGHPFNPFAESPPDTALAVEEREIGGLGIHLVQSLMDEATYTRRTNRNVIVLVKYLSQDPQPKKEPS
jgi:sigma-B regulation protein RsbU (phosphoserine phosphatase)